MPAPVFVGAGSGTVITTGTGTVSKTGCTAGNFLIAQVYEDGVAFQVTRSNRVNIEALNGVDNADTIYQTATAVGNPQVGTNSLYTGRVMANGTCSWDFTVGAAGADISVRMYEFSGVNTGPIISDIGENVGGSASGRYRATANVNTTILQPDLITSGPKELGVAFVALQGAQTLGDFTGETGGDFTEAVAEYSHSTGSGCTLQLQTAPVNVAGTIEDGTITIASASWGVMALALFPSNPSDSPSVAWWTA